MKKSLFIFFFCWAIAIHASNQSELIVLNTSNLSLVLEVNDKGTVLHQYFGQKLSDPSPFLLKKFYRTSEYGTRNEAYSTAGGKNFKEPALRVTHHDGDLNTELSYQKHERDIDKEKGIEELVIYLKDQKYDFEVKLLYKAYKKENVFTIDRKSVV